MLILEERKIENRNAQEKFRHELKKYKERNKRVRVQPPEDIEEPTPIKKVVAPEQEVEITEEPVDNDRIRQGLFKEVHKGFGEQAVIWTADKTGAPVEAVADEMEAMEVDGIIHYDGKIWRVGPAPKAKAEA